MGGSGSSSAFDVAGRNSGIVPIDYCSNYNGTSWASSGALPQSKYSLCAFGTVSAGVAHGGHNGSTSLSTCHTYNSSTWSTGGSLNVARLDHSDGSVVTVGGGSAACEIYGDNTPSTFGFTDVVDFQTLSTATTSDIVTPTGYTVTVAWTCSGGTASISGGAFASSGTINPGQTVQLKVTSSALYATAVSATVTIGGVSDTWYVTTRNAPIPQIIFL